MVGGLGLLNWWLLALELDISAIRPAAALADGVPAAAPPADDTPLADFKAIVERPVFNASRRPSAPAETGSVVRPPSDLQLIGVAIDGERKRALLKTQQQPRARWIEEGGSIEGWVVSSVRADGAIVASGQQTHELRLHGTPRAAR
jgi:hypothetical protein